MFFRILLFAEHVSLEWSGQEHNAFRSTKKGSIYLTTHRVIFLNKTANDEMQSFSFPFVTLSEVFIIIMKYDTYLSFIFEGGY